MKFLLIGNHTCGNRGDAAILRGLIAELEAQYPQAELTVTSRYPVSSSYLLGRPVIMDLFHDWHKKLCRSFVGKIAERLLKHVIPLVLSLLADGKASWIKGCLPRFFRDQIAALAEYDLVIQVGGSFFVDLYGSSQFDYPLTALVAGRPVVLIGHSMGPFEGRIMRRLSACLLQHAALVSLREPVSRELVQRYGLPMAKLHEGGDTAWLVRPVHAASEVLAWFGRRHEQRPVVAITVRELAPFDKRLNTTQLAYEKAFAKLADSLINDGYDVLAVSTCTGIDSYHRDDRMNALQVKTHVAHPEHFEVVMDELNDVQLGQVLAQCDLLIGTRLHSAIIAMNFGTPAIAVNYEHKSEGIMRQLGLADMAATVPSLLDGTLITRAKAVLASKAEMAETVSAAVALERSRTAKMITTCVEQAIGQGPR